MRISLIKYCKKYFIQSPRKAVNTCQEIEIMQSLCVNCLIMEDEYRKDKSPEASKWRDYLQLTLHMASEAREEKKRREYDWGKETVHELVHGEITSIAVGFVF